MKPKSTKLVIGFRPGPLAPIIDRWIESNQGKTTSDLIRAGIKRELRSVAKTKDEKHLLKFL